jgi:hypothetical protein
MNETAIPLTPQEQSVEAEMWKALTAQLLARTVLMQTSQLGGEGSGFFPRDAQQDHSKLAL